jgi:predicted RNase H-like HicB family nuclease
MELKVILEPGEDGFIVAHCPSLKSCWSQGRTREEALQNIREAIELYLEPDPEELLEQVR